MWAKTLAEAYQRINAGESREFAFAGFLDNFYGLADCEARSAALAEEPPLTQDKKLDALAGAAAEYLAKRYRLRIPEWAAQPVRYLREPWFTTPHPGPGMIEYLVHSSPAEFRSRNIFTESLPFRRASQRLANRSLPSGRLT